ncbi:hypothetical protein [Winogradskyella bathintestinalis]|uniref:Lipoprotein n=1 Tax=Winogradskyella bathintestinalis TaxID=3035208 RepID=A0ABT7ZRM2_9FLAO|nr:hypothetical protein [Winogradskyella bathintestinalis]MDN3491642.1 hypothetical protein [Winogradskyella bathintestinalis]
MKKYALLTILFLTILTSCSVDDGDSTYISTETLPIESVELPEQFAFNETYEILITYNRPTACHRFYNFFYDIHENERTIAVINSVYQDASCEESPESVTVSLNFIVTGTETYVFKFFQGYDEEGEEQYLVVEVPVLD